MRAVSNTMSVYVFPCSDIGEREMVRPDSHNGTIFIVKLLGVMSLHAARVLESPRKPGRSLGQRSGEIP